MRIRRLHEWDVTTAQARAIQSALAARIELRPLPPRLRLVAGADVSVSRELGLVFAAALVLRFPELEVVEQATACEPIGFPYVPGLLSFREGPALIAAFRKLRLAPDLVIFDGQGLAHPRRFGLACHMGLWLGVPAIGCAKSRLVGTHAEPGPRSGDWAALVDGTDQLGVVLRTRDRVRPVYVSPGHLADFRSSAQAVLACCRGFRLPEPTRQAHAAVGRCKKEHPRPPQ